MAPKKKVSQKKAATKASLTKAPQRAKSKAAAGDVDAKAVLARLHKMASTKVRAGMARYGIPDDNALGISVGDLKKLAKSLGPNHQLAEELWLTGVYEARMLATFVDEPGLVTSEQMERWRKDFDSWAICDTACFALFDRTAFAWQKVTQWARLRDEFGKRAAFALLASLTVHDKQAEDELYANGLLLIEAAAEDDRNFVKKAVNWALRSIGKRSAPLHAASVAVAQRLSESENAAARWVGKDALRELASKSVAKRLAGKRK